MTWKAYAETDTFHRYVDISVGQDLGHSLNLVDFPTPTRRMASRSESLPEAQPLHLDLDAAKALYEALDRIFGKHEETGVSDVLREALAKEQERVDRIIGQLLRPELVIETPTYK